MHATPDARRDTTGITSWGAGLAARKIIALVATVQLALAAPTPPRRLRAQGLGGWVQRIGTPGLNSPVAAMANMPGGDVPVGGSFTWPANIAANRIARFTLMVLAGAKNDEPLR